MGLAWIATAACALAMARLYVLEQKRLGSMRQVMHPSSRTTTRINAARYELAAARLALAGALVCALFMASESVTIAGYLVVIFAQGVLVCFARIRIGFLRDSNVVVRKEVIV
jgi:hypothetical protein